MKLETKDIVQVVGGGSVLSLILTFFASAMGWIRFGRKDKAEVEKIQSSTAIDMAIISEKKISDEIKISNQALQWTMNLATRLEQANIMIDKKQDENERLHGIIDAMKKDFQDVVDTFNRRIKELEREVEKSKKELIKEREENHLEIKHLKQQISNGPGIR